MTRRADVVEDVEWLIYCGETHVEAISQRLGYANPRSLIRALYRVGRPDLAALIHKTQTRQIPMTTRHAPDLDDLDPLDLDAPDLDQDEGLTPPPLDQDNPDDLDDLDPEDDQDDNRHTWTL